jgi:hypothetical protein
MSTNNSWVWDKWQKDVLAHEGNITLRTGRQVGKSEVVAAKAFKFALENPGTITLIIAAAQRQSSMIFEKVRGNVEREIEEKGEDLYDEPPTLTKIIFKNGSRIYSYPAGRTGYFIRGLTIDLLIADEAAYIPEIVWNAVLPMLAVSRKLRGMGNIILLSTPFGKGGYFYESFHDKDFRSFHVSSEDCKRISKAFLKKEKQRMTKAEYRQEYLGEFTDEFHQFFPTDLIKARMTFIEWSKQNDYNKGAGYYLGVDIARYGGDENAFVVCELEKSRLKIVKCFVTNRISTTDTIGRIIKIDQVYKFRKIFLDDGGLGAGVTDLLQERLGKRKVMGLNNSVKRIQVQGEEKKRGIFKEDLYNNALMLMETQKVELISDLKLLKSLKSITFEYTSEANIKIFGKYSHLAEAFVRACWCIKERGLRLFVY